MTPLYDTFKTPAKAYSPVPIWWWSGERLDPARLRWQLERFAEGGVHNLIVLNLAPTAPLYGSDADDPAFFSEEWWRIFEGVCADARELGVSLWFYDQIGFSGANLQGELVKARSDFAGQALERVSEVMRAPGALPPPGGGTPVAASATPVDADGAPAGEPAPLPLEDGVVRWGGEESARVSLYYTVSRGFDYFSAEACAQLLDTVHGAFERRVGQYFGEVIVGSFQDELPALPAWSAKFAAEFQARRGYDLLPRLAALWEDGGADAPAVRRDYHATRAELAEEAFFKPLFDWHEARGLVCGFDQQGPARAGYPVQTVRLYADYQRTHRWFQAPGSDHHGEAKIHSSLAHLYDRRRVWIESFHSSGWGGTLEETFDWLLQWLRAGATLYDPHAVYYSTRGGWWEWAPPSTDWRQPYWRHYPHFARAVSRLCAVLSEGHHVCDVGVLFPNATVQAGTRLDGQDPEARAAHEAYLALAGLMRWYKLEVGAMDRSRADYDVLDDASVQRGAVRDGALAIGEESYPVVVLPACTVPEAATAARLVEFVEAGGTLVAVGAPPRSAAGTGADDAPVRALAALFADGRARTVSTPEELLPLLAERPPLVEAPVPTLVRRVGDATIVFVPAAFPRATRMASEQGEGREASWVDVEYDFDPARYAREMTVTVRGVRGAPELWEPYGGERRAVEYAEHADGVEARVPFADGPGVLLVWPGAAGADGLPPRRADRSVLAARPLDGPWRVRVAPTLDNRWGDFTLPAATEPMPVERWRFRHAVEEEGADTGAWAAPGYDDTGWAEVVATFGPRGLWTGPAAPESLPAPGADPFLWDGGGEWREAEYSPERGIWKDPLHRTTLGPKGHVPEEFLDFGRVAAGEAVQFRAVLTVPESLSAHLALGAAAAKRVWLNGEELAVPSGGYLATVPVTLRAGANPLELRLEAEEDVHLRAHYALVRDPARYARPEWIAPADAGVRDSIVTFRRIVDLPWAPERAVMQVGANAPCRLVINGVEAGVQGGFDPYFERPVSRLQRYDVKQYVRPGRNTVEVRMSDLGRTHAVLVDARFERGEEAVTLTSGADWEVERDGAPRALRLVPAQMGEGDPSHSQLWRRPHPLPGAAWLEGPGADDGTVIPIASSARAESGRAEWVRFLVAPGARRMRLAVRGEAAVFLDGAPLQPEGAISNDPSTMSTVVGGGQPANRVTEAGSSSPLRADSGTGDGALTFALPRPHAPRRVCAVRVRPETGSAGGGLFAAPVRYEMGEGAMAAGSWEEQGLAGYSGGVSYGRTIERPAAPGRRLMLDLGRVRGTAEVRLNGAPVGVRIWSPYVFDLTEHVRDGANDLEVVVYNTLGPYLAVASPTRMVFPLQTTSGLLGPTRLLEMQ